MAEFIANVFNNITEYPNTFKRQGAFPLDAFSVFKSKSEAETYAAENPVAYVGQIVVAEEGTTVNAYIIANEAGALIKLASTSASGDLAGDVTELQSSVATLIANVNNLSIEVGDPASGDKESTGLYALIDALQVLVNGLSSITADLHDQIDNLQDEIDSVLTNVTGGEGVTVSPEGDGIKLDVKVDSTITNNALKKTTNGLKVVLPEETDYSVTVTSTDEKDTDGDHIKKYTFTQLGNTIATINVPKDMVVSSGKIVAFAAGDSFPEGVTAAGTYIELILANTDNSKLYINVTELLDEKPIEAKDTDTIDATVTVENGKYVVSAILKADSVGTTHLKNNAVTENKIADGVVSNSKIMDIAVTRTKLADNAVGTANIENKNVTKAKLEDSVQTSLGKADTAVQSVTIRPGEDDGTVEIVVDGVSTGAPVTGLKAAAFENTTDDILESTSPNDLPSTNAVMKYVDSTLISALTIERI